MQNQTENDRKPDERAGCAAADGSALFVGARIKTSAIKDEFLSGPASDVWVTKIGNDWVDVEYGPHIDAARIPKASILHVYTR